MESRFRLYTDLAWLWSLWGDPAEEYATYDHHVIDLMERHAQRPVDSLLNIDCGGGKNAFNLKARYAVTGLDLSPAMLVQAQSLNPDCRFLQGDMRTFALDERFDAVLMDDAISYMHCLDDLRAAFARAHAHLQPGGVMVVTPDVTRESFQQNRTQATTVSREAEGLDVVFVENVYDPDPNDEHYETTVVYLIRQHGQLRIETDRWTLGLFAIGTWRQVLRETGFELHEAPFTLAEDSYTVFACVKPG